jgi:hypothetical protein
LKLEYLILATGDESFCNSKEAFINFLQIDSSISVNDQKISYRREINGEKIVDANFHLETGIVEAKREFSEFDIAKLKRERYFLLELKCDDENLLDEFSELGDKIKNISSRICPGSTRINTLWDDIGRTYAEKAYPLINEVENLMRKLISQFMLINVGMEWSKESIDDDLFNKIKSYDEEELYINDLHKLDFIHLAQVLVDKKRDISLEELDRVLLKTNFNEEDKSKIRKYIPRSNWEKYFSAIIGKTDKDFEKKWGILYKLRNKVAHNRYLKKEEFQKIKGICSDIKKIINSANDKLGEIHLNEEDRQSVMRSYQSKSLTEYYHNAEKAVAKYYISSGYDVILERPFDNGFDFYALNESEKIAVEVKVRSRINLSHEKGLITQLIRKGQFIQHNEIISLPTIHLVIVIRDHDNLEYSRININDHLMKFIHELDEKIVIKIGYLNDENEFVTI